MADTLSTGASAAGLASPGHSFTNLWLVLVLLAAAAFAVLALKIRATRSKTVVIMGPVNSGKTCLLYKLVNGRFPHTVTSQRINMISLSTGPPSEARTSGCGGDTSVTVIDVSGNEDIGQHMDHIAGCSKFILMFDSTNRKSYKLLVNILLQLITLTYSSAAKGPFGLPFGKPRLDSKAKGASSRPRRASGAPSRQLLLVGNKNDQFNCKNVSEMTKIILLELELLLQNYLVSNTSLSNASVDPGLFEYLNELKSLSSLDDIRGFKTTLISYSVKTGDLSEILDYIAS